MVGRTTVVTPDNMELIIVTQTTVTRTMAVVRLLGEEGVSAGKEEMGAGIGWKSFESGAVSLFWWITGDEME